MSEREPSAKLRRRGGRKASNITPYRAIVESLPDVVFLQDLDLNTIFVTDSVQQELGYTPEEAMNLRLKDLFTDCGAKTVERMAKQLLKDRGGMISVEIEHVLKDGSTVWRDIALRALNTERLDGFVMCSRDIAKRRQARERSRQRIKAVRILENQIVELGQFEREFKNIEIKYRALVETMNDGLAMVDKVGRLQYVNRRFAVMLKCEREELIGQPLEDFLDNRNRQILKQQLAKRARGQEDSYELMFTNRVGGTIEAIVSPKPLFDMHGRFEGSFAVVTDVSRLKAVERQLKQSQQELILKNDELQELNTGLKVLIDRIRIDQKLSEEMLLRNVNSSITPHLHKLKQTRITEKQKVLINLIESSLRDLLSPAVTTLSSAFINLTPMEIQIAKLISQGKRTKEIAELLALSAKTIEYYRENLREKLGLKNKRINLQSYLNSLQ